MNKSVSLREKSTRKQPAKKRQSTCLLIKDFSLRVAKDFERVLSGFWRRTPPPPEILCEGLT